MNDLNKAYEIINSIPLDANNDLAFDMAKKALEESILCSEAAIIMSHCFNDIDNKEKVLLNNIDSLVDTIYNQSIKDHTLISNLNKANYELGSLYYEYGMYQKALKIFITLNDDNELVKYKLMNTYALLEDNKIEDYYKTLISDANEIEYARLSFTYMIYLYKKDYLKQARDLFKEIDKLNPTIKFVLNGEELDNDLTKEAYRILKNNSLLINSCPYLIKDVVLYNK